MATEITYGVPVSTLARNLRNGDTLIEFGNTNEYAKIIVLDRTRPGITFVELDSGHRYKFRNDDNVLLLLPPQA